LWRCFDHTPYDDPPLVYLENVEAETLSERHMCLAPVYKLQNKLTKHKKKNMVRKASLATPQNCDNFPVKRWQ